MTKLEHAERVAKRQLANKVGGREHGLLALRDDARVKVGLAERLLGAVDCLDGLEVRDVDLVGADADDGAYQISALAHDARRYVSGAWRPD